MVRVGDQVIVIALDVTICSLVRLLASLLLELSAFCPREFRFLCHGRRALCNLVLLALFFFFFFLFVVVIGIIVLSVTA